MHAAGLADKVALVTGGTRGVGLAIARAFVAAGARVVVSGHSDSTIAAAAPHLGDPGRWAGVAADLAAPEAPARLVKAAGETFGRIDVLVNNAGVVGPVDPWQLDSREWDRIQAVNLRAAFFCAREVCDVMRSAAAGGAIITVASVAGQIGGVATGPAYVASKAGLIGLTRSLARQFAPLGIRVNCIAPADIETGMTEIWPEELRRRLIAMTPLGRFGRVDEVSAAALFLASDAASYMTGQTLNVNGGIYMG